EGTRRYRDRRVAAGAANERHFREGLGGLALSTIGLGTYLGKHDGATDALYRSAVKQAVQAGCNVIDSAINYRCQRSERTIGQALAELIQDEACRRDEVLIATKGGFIPYDGAPPRDGYAYVQKTFITPGLFSPSDVVADCHCMTPTYLRHQIDTSLANLGLACLDVYYLHNPEIQLEQVTRDEFMKRMRRAFVGLGTAGGPASSVGGRHRRPASLAVRPLDAGHRNGAGRDEAGGPCPGQHGARAACAVVF